MKSTDVSVAAKIMLSSCVLFSLTACAAGLKGRADPPNRVLNYNNQSVYHDDIEQAMRAAAAAERGYCVQDSSSCPPEDLERWNISFEATAVPNTELMRYYRNNYIYEMMRAHELAMQSYARALSVEGNAVNLVENITQVGLTVAAGVTQVQETARVLNALAGGVIGLGAGYDEQVLVQNTVPVLLDKMKSAQANKRAEIFGRMGRSITDYPLSAARLDISTLGAAATFEAALSQIASEAEADLSKAEESEKIARDPNGCDTARTKLKALIETEDQELRKSRDKLVSDFFTKNNITPSVPVFLRDCAQAGNMAKLIAEIEKAEPS